jgi:NADH-quinone oxidoreductase subunit L
MAHDHNDEEGLKYARYFTYLNLFIAFMATLVLADNYLLMFVGWEGVGLCSYFLIGFWLQREDAAEASKKAFIMNRIGDFGFLLGIMLLFIATGSLKYSEVFAKAAEAGVFNVGLVGAVGGITAITLLLFVGACGKSAQVPLYTWLPDAMAGPTPVSALIHAATMVTAGVYMCARSSVLFELAPQTKLIVCAIGALTAIAAGLTALAHTDIKKVLAYSTVSQLGFMFMAVGAGAYSVAIFHVFTHAFFKACLFLGAGSVIHALHGEQDMRKMGGLAAKMKATNITFLLSGLALAGAVPFAGFFSKDEIIAEVFHNSANGGSLYILFGVVGLVTAFITALYTGRQYGQVFAGQPRDQHLFDHAHESPAVMTIPLYILTVGAVFAGFLGFPHLHGLPESLHAFTNWLEPVFHHGGAAVEESSPNFILLLLGVVIGWGGWIIGRGMGIKSGSSAVLPENANLSLDKVYTETIVKGGFGLAAASRWFDEKIVDGFVNGIGSLFGQISSTLRLTQTSFVRNYALSMALGAAVVIAYFMSRA